MTSIVGRVADAATGATVGVPAAATGVAATQPSDVVLAVNYLALRRLSEGLLDRIPSGGAIVNTASTAGGRWADHLDQINELLGTIGQTQNQANDVYWSQARPLLSQHDTRRKASDVATVLEAVRDQEQKLQKAEAALAEAGPYRAQPIEEARQVRLHYLNKSAISPKLTELAILLAARKWRDVLALQGPLPADAATM